LALFARHWVPTHNWLFTGHYALGFGDLHSRFADIWRLHHGYNLYSNHDHHQYFTYPPAALLLFWPLSWFAFRWDVLWWTALSLFALAGALVMALRRVRAQDSLWVSWSIGLWAALVAVVVLPVVSIGIALGQIGTFLLLAVTVDYLARRGSWRGFLTGIAAAIKIYPIVIVVAWAIRREWRLVANAVAAGAITSLVAFVLWSKATRTFITRQLLSGHELTHFLHNPHWLATSSSPYTIFFRWPFHGGSWASAVGWLASLTCVALGLWAATRLWRAGFVVGSLTMALAASALAGPVTWDHYYVFAPLLAVAAYEARQPLLRWSYVAVIVAYALPWQLGRNESFSVHGLNAHQLEILVARNALSAVTVALFLVAIWSFRSGTQRTDQSITPRAKLGVALSGSAPEPDDHGI
jgi:alpha-1,2-mannosyltransferase